MIVDFHSHYYPPSYIEELERGGSPISVTRDEQGNPLLRSPGDVNVVVPGHRDVEARTAVLQRAEVDRQVLTLTAPGTDIEEPERAVRLAQLVNDRLAEIVAERGHRFSALATLPMRDPGAATAELSRAMTELGLPGAMLFSNVSGVALSDRRYWPLYERAAELGAVLYIHPTYPVGVEAMEDYWLMPLVGFTFDTTLAAAKLAFSGVLYRFGEIRWVLAHLGGAIPYLAERLDRGYEAFAECRREIPRPPSSYLKQLHYDTVNFDPAALELALRFAGPERILAGSDYPHRIGSLEMMKASLAELQVSDEERASIQGGNALRLLGIDPSA